MVPYGFCEGSRRVLLWAWPWLLGGSWVVVSGVISRVPLGVLRV